MNQGRKEALMLLAAKQNVLSETKNECNLRFVSIFNQNSKAKLKISSSIEHMKCESFLLILKPIIEKRVYLNSIPISIAFLKSKLQS
jgi:hypothetical protein